FPAQQVASAVYQGGREAAAVHGRYRSRSDNGKLGRAFDAHVALHLPSAYRPERFFVNGGVVAAQGPVYAAKLDLGRAFVRSRFIDFCGMLRARKRRRPFRSPALQDLHRLADFYTDLRHCVLPFETYCAIARRSKARASSVPSRGRSVRRITFHPSFPRLSSQRLAPTRWMRKPAEVPWPESSRGVPCRSGTIICKY